VEKGIAAFVCLKLPSRILEWFDLENYLSFRFNWRNLPRFITIATAIVNVETLTSVAMTIEKPYHKQDVDRSREG
jgi:hypothetical protein